MKIPTLDTSEPLPDVSLSPRAERRLVVAKKGCHFLSLPDKVGWGKTERVSMGKYVIKSIVVCNANKLLTHAVVAWALRPFKCFHVAGLGIF